MMDFGTVLAYWVEAGDPPPAAIPRLRPHATAGQHDAPRADRILRRSDPGFDTSNVLFYYAFGLFKVAVIIQQIYYRYVQGFTKDERFANFDSQVAALAEEAQRAIREGTY